ncbi:Transposase IS4 [Popillia japonica]|uniref:Transposase IS4 n=1 Tax=Popillia japonica TaxID=7064 RepID=A0AAW1IF57_POPJA
MEISDAEMKCLIGVLILTGYSGMSRRRMYWLRDIDAHNELVSNAINRDKIEYIILAYIHNALLEENNSVDEAMVLYFGCHECKQFIQEKPINDGSEQQSWAI